MRVAVAVAVLIGFLGCGHDTLFRPLPSEEFRGALGTMGVVSGRFPPEVKLRTPAKGRLAGAGREAARGALVGVLVGAPSIDYLTSWPILLGAAIGLTAGSLIGGASGAVSALPAETVEEAEAELMTALADLAIQETMGERVFRILKDRYQLRSVLLSDQGPNAPDRPINYRSLSDKGIDTVLEVSILAVGLDGGSGAFGAHHRPDAPSAAAGGHRTVGP